MIPDGRNRPHESCRCCGHCAIAAVKPKAEYNSNSYVPFNLSLLHCIYTKQAVQDTEHEILSRRPAYIFIRAESPAQWGFEDVWEEYHHFVESHYTLTEHVGMYEMWKLAA